MPIVTVAIESLDGFVCRECDDELFAHPEYVHVEVEEGESNMDVWYELEREMMP